MGRPVLVAVGVLVAVMGTIFFFQGIGVLGGSAMTGQTLWAVLGPIIAVAGLAVAGLALRRPGPRA
jgi:hypothetical protein